MMFGIMLGGDFSGRDHLEEALDNLERAARFSVDESSLRNTIIRIHFNLDTNPPTFMPEFGPDGKFVIPISENFDEKELTGTEEDEDKKKTNELNKKFNPLPDFKENYEPFFEELAVVGIGHGESKKLTTEGHYSIYFYPTGEKDQAIVFLALDNKMVSLSFNPFHQEYIREYYDVPDGTDSIEERRLKLAQDEFLKWQKN